ncbi:MAG TPA: NAD(P)H-dependent oxidoreductase [Streptosporangiaceae bacterium]
MSPQCAACGFRLSARYAKLQARSRRKNAIDSVFLSYGFRNKPMAAVGYSTGVSGAIRAVEHLAQVAVEVEAAPLRSTLIIPFADRVFGEDGEPTDAATTIGMQVLLEDLAWWADALHTARQAGELVPGKVRSRLALAAAAAR